MINLNTLYGNFFSFMKKSMFELCPNMAKSGINPKTLQYIMGHSDISVTLNTYAHVNFDDAKKELKKLGKAE